MTKIAAVTADRLVVTDVAMDDLILAIYERLLESGREWRIDGMLQRPSREDVEILVARMVDQVRKTSGSISISSGGILVQRVDDHIDVYYYVGEAK